MNRNVSLQALQSGEPWDILVIGGGASGLGAAVDAAARGYRTALIEQHDFAKATSSRSTKLIHGGVRYLRQGNVSLVRESLRERALLLRNAPHLTRRQTFIVPAYSWIDPFFYGAGLKLYDALSGRLSLGPSQVISRSQTLADLPGVQPKHLRGGIRYYDGQFDDARLALSLAQTLHDLGGFAANYVPAVSLLKNAGKIVGVLARDAETGVEFEIHARVVINATGVFTDSIRRLDNVQSEPLVTASQGAHIVVDQSFLPGNSALMVPKTRDGRVLFAIPWHDRIVIGTTDTPTADLSLEPRPLRQEIEFLLEHAALYLSKPPAQSDILSCFAGLRPLVKASGANTAQLSRDHTIVTSDAGLVTITGGKWTTYRKMAEDVVARAAEVARLDPRPCRTRDLPLHAADADTPELSSAAAQPLTPEAIAQFARTEMARTVEDVLARRTRLLILDPAAALQIAPLTARILTQELGRDQTWQTTQLDSFQQLTQTYRP